MDKDVARKPPLAICVTVMPIIRNSKRWSDYDYYILVDEVSRHDKHEAVWLIKDEKIKDGSQVFIIQTIQI